MKPTEGFYEMQESALPYQATIPFRQLVTSLRSLPQRLNLHQSRIEACLLTSESAITDSQPRAKKQDRREATNSESSEGAEIPAQVSAPTKFLPIVLVGPHWHARESLQNIIVFGDSYSKSNEGQTWVDVIQQQLRSDTPNVSNLAFPGATAETDFAYQLSGFLSKVDDKPGDSGEACLDPGEATYIIFFGINDCGAMGTEDLESIVEGIFDDLHRLYRKSNARNFVLFDVPPTDRSPQAVDSDLSAVLEDNIKTWNDALRDQAAEFRSSNKDVTVFVFSAHQVLTDVLDDPLEYEFSEDDPAIEGGHIWEDGLHLTSDMHDILCKQLLTSILADQL
ncbi:Carbohydrate esterase family 16 protein [Pleurotus pulmonarius]